MENFTLTLAQQWVIQNIMSYRSLPGHCRNMLFTNSKCTMNDF